MNNIKITAHYIELVRTDNGASLTYHMEKNKDSFNKGRSY